MTTSVGTTDTHDSLRANANAKSQRQGPHYSLYSMRFWDVRMPPVKKHMVQGYLVPTMKGAVSRVFSKQRRISVNIYRRSSSDTSDTNQHADAAASTVQTQLFHQLLKGISTDEIENNVHDEEYGNLLNDDICVLRVLKPKPIKGNDDDDQEENVMVDGDWDNRSIGSASMSSLGFGGMDEESTVGVANWRERLRYKLENIEIVKASGKVCDIKLGVGSETKIRSLHFTTPRECQSFVKVMEHMKVMERERAKRKAEEYRIMTTSSRNRASGTSTDSQAAAAATASSSQSSSPKERSLSLPLASSSMTTTTTTPIRKSPFNYRFPFYSMFGGGGHDTDITTTPTISSTEPARSSLTDNPKEMKSRALFESNSYGPQSSGGRDATLDINLLIEIVSASNLPAADIYTSDPYIVVREASKEVHRTKVISKTLNPIWTLETGSLFLIHTTAEEFFLRSNFVSFVIKDYDSVGSNEIMGSVEIDKSEMLKGTGKRMEYDVEFDVAKYAESLETNDPKQNKKATLALRFKHASQEDIEFLQSFTSNSRWHKGGGMYSEESFLPPRPHQVRKMKRMHRKGHDSIVQYRVKPGPAPERELETAWMTNRELRYEARKPSTNWIESGSGKLGKVYLEVIGCNKLPNLDYSLTGRDKTDAFVCAVFEDCVVNTDVINDTLSPRWMPWSQRAFVFNILHPSSQLMLGVFDYDPGLGIISEASHDVIGKVNVNMTNCSPGTVYTLKYDLIAEGPEGPYANGQVTVRCRVEWFDERKTLVAAVIPPSPCYVSVEKKVDFKITQYTLVGEENPHELSIKTITSYVEELKTYQAVLDYLQKAVFTVFLWRGHYKVSFRRPAIRRNAGVPETAPFSERWTKPAAMWLPLHSMIAFVWGVLVVQNFDRFLAFLVFAIGWFFLATMEQVRAHPSPWCRCRSYSELLCVLVFGCSFGPQTVEVNENIDEIRAHKADTERQEKKRKGAAEALKMEREKLEIQLNEAGEEAEDEELDITTKVRGGYGFNITPFKGILEQVQHFLRKVCVALRIGKNVVLWRESYAAFSIVTASFVLSLIIFWIPWSFLIAWTCRIFVWVLLGPWMKLVDIFYVRKWENLSPEERKAGLEMSFQERYHLILEQSLRRKVARERALKLQVMKKYMFGKFLMRVPIFKEELECDDPLPASTATPYDESIAEPIVVSQRKWGQQLVGDMIPTREKNMKQATKEKATTKVASPSKSDEPTSSSEKQPLLSMPEEEASYGAAASVEV